MTAEEPRLTRRALLGAAALVLAGCKSRGHASSPDADAAAIASARAGELTLLSAYADGTPEHALHLTHLRALGGAAPTPGGSASPTATPAYSDVRSSVAVLQAAAAQARSGATAAMLASIAASHAVLTVPRL